MSITTLSRLCFIAKLCFTVYFLFHCFVTNGGTRMIMKRYESLQIVLSIALYLFFNLSFSSYLLYSSASLWNFFFSSAFLLVAPN